MKALLVFGSSIQGVHHSCQSETASSGLLQIKLFSKQAQKAHFFCLKKDRKRNLSSYMQNNFKAISFNSCVTLSPSLITGGWIHIKLYGFKIITLTFKTRGQVFC